MSKYIFNQDRRGINQIHQHKLKNKLAKLQTLKTKSKIVTILNKRKKAEDENKSDQQSEKKGENGLVNKIFDRFIQKDE